MYIQILIRFYTQIIGERKKCIRMAYAFADMYVTHVMFYQLGMICFFKILKNFSNQAKKHAIKNDLKRRL